MGYSPWRRKESDTTKRLSIHTHTHTHTRLPGKQRDGARELWWQGAFRARKEQDLGVCKLGLGLAGALGRKATQTTHQSSQCCQLLA